MEKKHIDYYYNAYVHYFKLYEAYINKSNVIWLKYEDYYNNFDNIFDKLSTKMNIDIDKNLRDQIKKEHSLDKNKTFSNDYKSFKEYDNNDLSGLHGNHIFKGTPGSWELLVSEQQHEYMDNIFEQYLTAWNYNE